MKKAFSILLTTLAISSINAQTIEIDGINYNITSATEPYTVEVTEKIPDYSGDIVIPSTIEDNSIVYSVTGIAPYSFYGCHFLTSLQIPNSVKTIGKNAIDNCQGLTSLNIPNSVKSIGSFALSYCTHLTSISIPDSVQVIEDGLFYNCTGLNSITITNSVTTIGDEVFTLCPNLTSIDVTPDNSSFSSIDGVLYSKDATTVTRCPEGKSSVVLPESVTSIGDNAFQNCTGLTSIALPDAVTQIGVHGFSNCTGLTSILIPDSVTIIGIRGFYKCTGLTSIAIPSSVVSIGLGAFQACSGLDSILSYPITPPILGDIVFKDVPKTIPLYVPAESIDAYKAADQWKDFTNIIPLGTVTDIDGNVYNTVKIGAQTWMRENLKTTRYSDGTAIPLVNSTETWDALTSSGSAYCWYDDDINNKDVYGALYTWAAAMNGAEFTESIPSDVQGVCPEGWHLPSWNEWGVLLNFLDPNVLPPYYSGGGIAGGKMKETGTTNWQTPNTGATNESGFTALPGGARADDGVFYYEGAEGLWWSTSKFGSGDFARVVDIKHDYSSYWMYSTPWRSGVSVRCLQNSESSMSITVQDTSFSEGLSLEVPISVSELTAGDNIISYQFDIDYDNTTLEYSAADLTGTLAEGGTVTVNSSVAGTLNISYMNTTALVGEGDILNLKFNTLKADTTEVAISNAFLNSRPVTDLTNGTAIVKDITPPTAAITYDDTEIRCGDDLLITATFDEPMLETNAVKLSLAGGATRTGADMTRVTETVYTYVLPVPNTTGDVTISLGNGTDLWGNEVVSTPVSGGTFSTIPITYGDVDDDGTILAYDAALALQYSVDMDPLPVIDPLPWENWRDTTANVDKTGKVTANDAGMILQYSAKIITSFTGSAKKSVSQAFIGIEVVSNTIILYAYGDLLGLNVSVVNRDQILGTPEVLAEDFLSATNISGTTYNIGICTKTPPESGTRLLKIPYNKNGTVNLNMNVNTETDVRTLNLALVAGTGEIRNENITLYPNPAGEMLHVEGLQKETAASICNTRGQMVFSGEIGAQDGKVNVANLPAGIYILKMRIEDEIVVKRFAKK